MGLQLSKVIEEPISLGILAPPTSMCQLCTHANSSQSENSKEEKDIVYLMLVYFYLISWQISPYILSARIGSRLIPKQISGKRDGMTTTGLNEYFRVGWVLGQEVMGTISSMEFQVGAHSSTMKAIGFLAHG